MNLHIRTTDFGEKLDLVPAPSWDAVELTQTEIGDLCGAGLERPTTLALRFTVDLTHSARCVNILNEAEFQKE